MQAEREHVLVESRAQWRGWLAEHAAGSPGCWAVTWRRGSGRPVVAYEDLVEEALCVGWVDSTARRVDEQRSALRSTPRKRGSGWARTNKERFARLEAAGLMRPAGQAVVAAARADGSWTLLDDVEALREPPDLGAELDARPVARAAWDAFPPSARRALLAWIVQAKRPETRARRIAETADRATAGERANQWRPAPPPASRT